MIYHILTHLCVFPCLLISLNTVLLAESEPSQPTKVINCTYICWDETPNEQLFFRMADEYLPMEFMRGKRSNPISVARMDTFQVYRKKNGSGDEAPLHEFVGETLVPKSAKELLFLIIPPDEQEEKYRVFALDDSVEVFGRKTFRFVNLTKQTLSVEFANNTQDIYPDADAVIPTKVDESGGFVPCIMRNPESKIIFGTRLFCQPNSREMVLIRTSMTKNKNKPRVKFFSQFVPDADLAEDK